MRIAIISIYSGINNRGVESFASSLANHLVGKKVEVNVFQAGKALDTPYKTISIAQKIRGNDLSHKHLLKRLFLDNTRIDEFTFVTRIIAQLKNFDIVIPLISGWPIPLLKILTRVWKTKLVMIGQSGPGWDDRWNLIWKPDLFVCLTNTQQSWAQKASIWKNQKYAVIPNGVDLTKFNPNGPKAKLELDKPIIVTVAASTAAKRIDSTIKAVAKLSKGSLLLLGKGPLDKDINQLAAKELGANRFLHISLNHLEVPEYLRSATVFTLCSESTEAFGTVYVEALASNLPCVATDDKSRREIIKNAGLYVQNPNDTLSYSQTLQQTIDTDWGNKPLSQAKVYDWKSVGDRYYKQLSDLLQHD